MGSLVLHSDRTVQVMKQIEDVLHERGSATTLDLVAVTGLSQNRVGEFLREMRKVGTAVRIECAGKIQSGSKPARWGPGTASANLPETDDLPRKVLVLNDWPRGARRMDFETYLFGPAGMAAA